MDLHFVVVVVEVVQKEKVKMVESVVVVRKERMGIRMRVESVVVVQKGRLVVVVHKEKRSVEVDHIALEQTQMDWY